MARVSVTTVEVAATGTAVVPAAASALGHIVDAGKTLMVINGGGGSINVTLDSTATQDGLAVADRVVAVAAGATKFIPTGSARTFAQPADAAEGPGRVHLDYSGVSSVTHAVIGA